MSSFDVAMKEHGQIKQISAFSLIFACALCFTLVTTVTKQVPRYGLSKRRRDRRRDTTYMRIGEGAVQSVITMTGQGKTTVSEHCPKSTTYILQK